MKAIQISGGSPPVHTLTYNQFRGVDFSTDPMLVDRDRSPYAINLISDAGGMPERRVGWRTIANLQDRVNGLWYAEINEAGHYICHAGTKILDLKISGADIGKHKVLLEGVNDDRSTAIFLLGKLYIFTGAEYLQFDGEKVEPVKAYVPLIVVNRKPAGGGDFIEPMNLLGNQWKEEFIGDGKEKEFQLVYKDLSAPKVLCEIFDGKKWVEKTEGSDFTVDRPMGKVTFKVAPATSTLPNVRITPSKDRPEKAAKINKAKSAVVYNDGTIFAAGAEKGVDYRSGFAQPGYWPDTGYDRVGTDETDIMGYCKIGENLAIIKESNNQDSTIFLRWASIEQNKDGNRETVYRKKQGVVGVGAVSRYAIGTLLDEPLFLSSRGIFALTSNAITYERTVQNRSEFLDFQLTQEPGLQNAVCTEWRGYYLLCVNNRCYVLDSKQGTQKSRSSSQYVYEGYFWLNIPARVFLSINDVLYFGTEDGRICRFNTDIENLERFNDDGAAIQAVWTSKMDDDGYAERLKTLNKKGCAVTLKPFIRSSVEVAVRTEKDPKGKIIRKENIDIFSWEDIDFERFSFDSNDGARDVMLRKKVRKYKRLQIIVMNNQINEGFGIFQIAKAYTLLGLAKR